MLRREERELEFTDDPAKSFILTNDGRLVQSQVRAKITDGSFLSLSLALALVEAGLALCTSGHLQGCVGLPFPEGSPTPPALTALPRYLEFP